MTSQLPFSLITTTKGLLHIAAKDGTKLFTYDPHLGVLHGIGDITCADPSLFTPAKTQTFTAPVGHVRYMAKVWGQAADENMRTPGSYSNRNDFEPDATLPFTAALAEPFFYD